MAHPLQYRQAAQRIGLPPACAKKHRSDGPEVYDALTIKLVHGWGHARCRRVLASWQGAAVSSEAAVYSQNRRP